ncbi:hypothetical protein AVDCRST_MAG81-3646 [uncultured Synechococcales cyanobacterium]|uniref:Uncharacterized protein n=1 Tax=uncultured Synechococcales cyanobacterium TaxID=1936017 RepID=A0A6J4VRL3_9CYAN|nr:hypothetical protein AVDCRST_MAG81-3646 [uncultured Synechococcales cyanobacterium]
MPAVILQVVPLRSSLLYRASPGRGFVERLLLFLHDSGVKANFSMPNEAST